MKLITFAIPCYNSEAYMRKCIDSILVCKENLEIIIVDDGSTDGTAAIADEYAVQYPDIIRVVHQENGGHGEAVNTGLRNATGLYYKVVDSDDWLDEESLKKVMETLSRFKDERRCIDMLICNYVYEHVEDGTSRSVYYTNALPQNETFGWSMVKRFRPDQNLLMHSVIYRTKILRKCGLELPKHTFYVDNLFVYVPLPYVKTLYYLNVDLYRYFIGRSDQSVNEQNMIKRVDQQIRVNNLMIDAYDLTKDVDNKYLTRYMFGYLSMICCVTSIILLISGTEENLEKRNKLWKEFKERSPKMYKRVRRGLRGMVSNLKGPLGRKLGISGYHAAKKIWKFN